MGISLDALDADLRQGLNELLQLLSNNGVGAQITSTFRTYREQKFLWDRYSKGEAQFPAAPPYHSAHEYGWAFDLLVSPNDLQSDVGATWEKYWGGSYGGKKDPIHFELPGASQTAFKLGEDKINATDPCPQVQVSLWDYIGWSLDAASLVGLLVDLGYTAMSQEQAVKVAKALHLHLSASDCSRL